jgi:MFS family permease
MPGPSSPTATTTWFGSGRTARLMRDWAWPAALSARLRIVCGSSSVPALVGRSQIGRANSYFEAVYSAGYIIGPAIAGVLAATIGPGPTLAIDALSFVLSALGLLLVRRDLRAPVDRPRRRLLTEIREGIDFIAADPTLRTVILFWGATSILLAPLVTALAVHVTRDLGEPPSVLGLILASYGVGPCSDRSSRLVASGAAGSPRSCSAGTS